MTLRGDTIIKIVEVKSRILNGCTTPYIVWCNDGKTYVVKFPGNSEGKKALVNEFVSSKLASILGLPVLDYALISVSLEDYKSNMEKDLKFMSGTAFGTVYNDRLLNVLNPNQIARTVNCNDAIKIIIFDLLIGNNDRNKGNLMIDSNSKKLIMIDHTHVFTLETLWDAYQLSRVSGDDFDISKLNQYNYRNLSESIKYTNEFYVELFDFVNKVKNVKKEKITEIVNDIPSDWNVTKDEKEALTNYIYDRFSRIEEILEKLNLEGGEEK